MIANSDGGRTTPSWVAFSAQDGTRLVGQGAKNQAAANPTNTVNDAKRLIGRRFTDAAVQHDMKLWPFTIKSVDGKPNIEVEALGSTMVYSPEEISAMVLISAGTAPRRAPRGSQISAASSTRVEARNTRCSAR